MKVIFYESIIILEYVIPNELNNNLSSSSLSYFSNIFTHAASTKNHPCRSLNVQSMLLSLLTPLLLSSFLPTLE